MFTQKMKKIMLTGMAVLAMGALVAGCAVIRTAVKLPMANK